MDYIDNYTEVFSQEDVVIVGSSEREIAKAQSDWNETDESKISYIKNKPEKLSQFENDGDGSSPFITEDEAQELGGKIEHIFKNGEELTIETIEGKEKSVNIEVPTDTSDLTNGAGFVDNSVANLQNYYDKSTSDSKYATQSELTVVSGNVETALSGVAENAQDIQELDNRVSANETNIDELMEAYSNLDEEVVKVTTQSLTDEQKAIARNNIGAGSSVATSVTVAGEFVSELEFDADPQTQLDNINAVIPAQASSNNKLADRAFVNSTVQTATANFRGEWENWASVPMYEDEYPADYLGVKTPSTNDYMTVRDASGYGDHLRVGTWRFKYSGLWSTDGRNGWYPEYQVNETPLTAAQLAALNSGITDTLVGQIGRNEQSIADLGSEVSERVDFSSAETITGVKTFSNGLKTSSIDNTGDINIKRNGTTKVQVKDGVLNVSTPINPTTTGTNDLGETNYKWRNIYMSGIITDGTHSVNVDSICSAINFDIGSNTYTYNGHILPKISVLLLNQIKNAMADSDSITLIWHYNNADYYFKPQYKDKQSTTNSLIINVYGTYECLYEWEDSYSISTLIEPVVVNEADSSLSSTSKNAVQNKVLYNPVSFAESERQKTINLCNNDAFVFGDIVTHGTVPVDSTTVMRTNYFISVKPNTIYTLSINNPNSISLLSIKTYSSKDYSTGGSLADVSNFPYTFTTPSTVNYVIVVAVPVSTSSLTDKEIQLEEGSVSTEYQPYNGAIVHEKELDDNIALCEKKANKVSYPGGDWGSETKYPNLLCMTDYARGLDTFNAHRTAFSTDTELLDWVKNTAPVGSYVKYIQIGGSAATYIIQKTTSSYSAILKFSYAGNSVQINRLVAGSWIGWANI